MFSLGELATANGVSSPPDGIVAGGHTVLPQKFYHPNASRNALGLIAGNNVSLIAGNLVDLESDLRNITRDLSDDPKRKYQPGCPLGGRKNGHPEPAPINSAAATFAESTCPAWPKQLVFAERGTGKVVSVDTSPRHLPTTQLFSYPGYPAPQKFVQEVYGAPWRF